MSSPDDLVFGLVDATGAAACELEGDGAIKRCSSGLARMLGTSPSAGTMVHELIPELGPLDNLPERAGEQTVRIIGGDEMARQVAPALVRSGGATFLVLVDRSAVAKAKREHNVLTRQLDELQEELEARRRAPRKNRVRPEREVVARLEESIARAKRYRHEVTVLHVRIEGSETDAKGKSKVLLTCIRGVDDLGAADGDPDRFTIVLPHTPLGGGKIVAERIAARAKDAGLSAGVGVARAGDEGAQAVVSRAASACRQATAGSVLVAVEVV